MNPDRGRARALMLQGTGSHVGKTVLTVAFCRIYRDTGLRVAPSRCVRARLARETEAFDAYEIHLGRTSAEVALAPLALVEEPGGPRPEGAVSADGRVWGTYLHGLFDAAPVRAALLRGLVTGTSRAGQAESYRGLREREYGRLAGVVAAHVDLAALGAIVGIP